MSASAETLRVGPTLEDYQELVAAKGWGDGLPVVPPTPERVQAMLDAVVEPADLSLGLMPPSRRETTVEAIAVNAVMAGCRPEHFAVVLAAVRAVLDPAFNLYGIQATTNPVAPLILVNGPGAAAMGFNGGSNCLGTGWPANATVGRALRLVMSNIGDAKPDGSDRATHGFPGKFTFCTAENEAASPWGPFHVWRGYEPTDTVVTVMGIAQFHNIVEFVTTEPDEILAVLAANLAIPGTNNISYGGEPALALCPEHAEILGSGGYSRDDVARYLFEHARCDMSKSPPAAQAMLRSRRPSWCELADWPICDRAEDLLIFVCGGPGTHSLSLPSFGPTTAISRKVESQP